MKNPDLKKLLDLSNGRFFSLTFVRKDGVERTVCGKNRYARLVKGGKSTVADSGYTSAVDRNANGGEGGWFCAKGERVKRFKCGKLRYGC